MRRLSLATLGVAMSSLAASAGVIGADDRRPLAALAAGAPEDRGLATAAGASGLVTCDNGRFGSASLVGRADIVVTAGHVFRPALDAIRAGRVRCIFIPGGNPGGPRIPVELRTLRLGAERVTGVNICSNGRDWAVARLAAPATGVTPYRLATAIPAPGTAVAIVSHGGGSGSLRGPGGHAGRCTVRDHVGPCRQTGLPLLFTDCDAEEGSSGGAILVRDGPGWTFGGMTRGASPSGGAAYDRERAYHMALPAAGPLAAAIRAMFSASGGGSPPR
jgi:hypothetical protein